jgi:hypothetical protein
MPASLESLLMNLSVSIIASRSSTWLNDRACGSFNCMVISYGLHGLCLSPQRTLDKKTMKAHSESAS